MRVPHREAMALQSLGGNLVQKVQNLVAQPSSQRSEREKRQKKAKKGDEDMRDVANLNKELSDGSSGAGAALFLPSSQSGWDPQCPKSHDSWHAGWTRSRM